MQMQRDTGRDAVTHAGIDAHARAQTDRNRWRHGCRCRQTQRDEEAGAQGYRCRPRWRCIRRRRYVDRAHGLSELKEKALTPAAFLLETHWWANQNLCTVRKHSRACLTSTRNARARLLPYNIGSDSQASMSLCMGHNPSRLSFSCYQRGQFNCLPACLPAYQPILFHYLKVSSKLSMFNFLVILCI